MSTSPPFARLACMTIAPGFGPVYAIMVMTASFSITLSVFILCLYLAVSVLFSETTLFDRVPALSLFFSHSLPFSLSFSLSQRASCVIEETPRRSIGSIGRDRVAHLHRIHARTHVRRTSLVLVSPWNWTTVRWCADDRSTPHSSYERRDLVVPFRHIG